MSRDSRPPLPGCTQPSFLRAEWETGDRLSPRDSVGDSKERGLCNETSSRRTRRLEGLAEARGSWKGQERGAGDLFSLPPPPASRLFLRVGLGYLESEGLPELDSFIRMKKLERTSLTHRKPSGKGKGPFWRCRFWVN